MRIYTQNVLRHFLNLKSLFCKKEKRNEECWNVWFAWYPVKIQTCAKGYEHYAWLKRVRRVQRNLKENGKRIYYYIYDYLP